jgi:hypothetical protein
MSKFWETQYGKKLNDLQVGTNCPFYLFAWSLTRQANKVLRITELEGDNKKGGQQ